MAIIPGNTGTPARAVDGLEGPTAGSPVVFPSGLSGNFVPTALADANATLTSANSIVVMTPSANRVLTLPSSVPSAAFAITVINRSASFTIALNASGGGTVATVGLGEVTILSTITNPTTTAHWTISTNGAALQGGNSFGATMLLGTNDSFGLDFETNGTVKLGISAAGAVTLGPPVVPATNGVLHRIRTGDQGSTISIATAEHGILQLGNQAGSEGSPSLAGVTTDNIAGLAFFSGSTDTNTAGDMLFDVRLNSNASFTTTGNKAFVWRHAGSEISSMTRAGAWTLGVSGGTPNFHNIVANISSNYACRIENMAGADATCSVLRLNSNTASGARILSCQNANVERFSVDGAGNIGFGNSGSLGLIAATGAWTLGPASFSGTHTVNGSDTFFQRDFNGTTQVSVSNQDAGSSVYAGFRCRSNAGDAFFIKNSIANTAGAAEALRVINETGGVYLAVGGTSWLAISDMRHKTKVQDLGNVLAGIQGLSTFTYKLNGDDGLIGEGPTELGLSAQELKLVAPEIVNGSDDTSYSVSYDRLSVVLVKAIQEQQVLIQSLSAKVEELKAELDAAKNRITELEGA